MPLHSSATMQMFIATWAQPVNIHVYITENASSPLKETDLDVEQTRLHSHVAVYCNFQNARV